MNATQLEQEILCFSEGLRVIGVNPEDKLALFADNSCRWLIADQGQLITPVLGFSYLITIMDVSSLKKKTLLYPLPNYILASIIQTA